MAEEDGFVRVSPCQAFVNRSFRHVPHRRTRRLHRSRCPYLNPWINPRVRIAKGAFIEHDTLLLSKYNFNRREFYIDLFSQWRFFRKGIVASDIHPDDLTMAWTAFVSTYMRSSEAWFGAFFVARAKFIENRMNGAMMDLHQASVEDGRRCAVPAECDCPF
ncbi:hypothetical protein PR003_g14347 [Phytophthora rubi]|uniref:Uncharacterized protein n=1 Tax=Phytophthora rubi TaxID=129364 RepID=A0A6A4F4E0_9STRA|nr:hypothetical protein PR003_g14347 [Phytophthora rubi]